MSFVEKVACWYGEGTMQEELESFLNECGPHIDVSSEEQNHENKKYFDQFVQCIENALAAFCEEEGITESEFYKRCEEDTSKRETDQKIVAAILSGASYESFQHLVKEWQEEQKEERS